MVHQNKSHTTSTPLIRKPLTKEIKKERIYLNTKSSKNPQLTNLDIIWLFTLKNVSCLGGQNL